MKSLKHHLLITLAILGFNLSKAQVTLTAVSNAGCGSPTTSVVMFLSGPVPTASAYIWVLAGPSPATTGYTATSTGISATLPLPATGLYTVTMYPVTSGSVILTASILSNTFNLALSPTVTIAASSTNICAGNSVTLTASGATNYT